jgi:hypothetical protein
MRVNRLHARTSSDCFKLSRRTGCFLETVQRPKFCENCKTANPLSRNSEPFPSFRTCPDVIGQICVARHASIPCFSGCSVAGRILTGTHQNPYSHLSVVKRILSSTWSLRRSLGDFLGTLRARWSSHQTHWILRKEFDKLFERKSHKVPV